MKIYWYKEGFEALCEDYINGYLTEREYNRELADLLDAERERQAEHNRNQFEYI